MIDFYRKRSGLNNMIWFLIGRNSMVINRKKKMELFPKALHSSPQKRFSSRVRIEWIDVRRTYEDNSSQMWS